MKRITFFIAFLLFLPTKHFAQSNDKLPQYHKYITIAENFIIKNELASGLLFYQKAFNYKDKPFASDIHNAIIACINIDSTDLALKYCLMLAEKGVGVKYFNQSIFSELKTQKKWSEVLKKAENRTKEIETQYGVVLEKIKIMVDRDQEVHIERAQRSGEHDIEVTAAALRDSISKQLLLIFNQYGFLNEDKIGVKNINDSTFSFFPVYDIIILHDYKGLLRADTLFQKTLRDAVFNGNIKPELFVSYNDWAQKQSIHYGTNMYRIYKDILYRYKELESWLVTVYEDREAIMIYDLENYEKRVKYRMNNPDSKYMIFGICGKTGSFGNEDSEQYFFENFKTVE